MLPALIDTTIIMCSFGMLIVETSLEQTKEAQIPSLIFLSPNKKAKSLFGLSERSMEPFGLREEVKVLTKVKFYSVETHKPPLPVLLVLTMDMPMQELLILLSMSLMVELSRKLLPSTVKDSLEPSSGTQERSIPEEKMDKFLSLTAAAMK